MANEYTGADGGPTLRARLRAAPLLLDGAIGTELERRGIACALPLWSTHALIEAPDTLAAIHREYLEAGAEVLTADTFRTQRHVLAKAGAGERARELTERAVALAQCVRRDAALEGSVRVAGSVPPLEDCYEPASRPNDRTLAREHARHCDALAGAGVDLLLLETHNSIAEARAAARAAAHTGLPFFVSFVCRGRVLLSGEALADAVEALRPSGPQAILVNCIPPADVMPLLEELRVACGTTPYGVYPNLGPPGATPRHPHRDHLSPEAFARAAGEWVAAGARVVGGCCGTAPRHIRATAQMLQQRADR